MTRAELLARTKRFALDVVRLCSALPKRPELQMMSRQLMRSATSVGANYRAACRAKSRADFVNKLAIVEEEADETLYWLELIGEVSGAKNVDVSRLREEASQLVAIVVASKKTARKK